MGLLVEYRGALVVIYRVEEFGRDSFGRRNRGYRGLEF